MFDEAFMMILRQVQLTQTKGADLNNDSMMLIKALGKVGCKCPSPKSNSNSIFLLHSLHREPDLRARQVRPLQAAV